MAKRKRKREREREREREGGRERGKERERRNLDPWLTLWSKIALSCPASSYSGEK